jgi:signal transduction histidine kinase
MAETAKSELDHLLGKGMMELVPFNVAVIDRDFNIVAANSKFEDFFGANWRNHRCYEVYKKSSKECEHCQARKTFEDGRVRVSDHTGVDRHGRSCQYAMHIAPLRDESGAVKYVMEMTSELMETRTWRREYDLLFNRVPCPAYIINRDFQIERTNEKFVQIFGEPGGKPCYQVLKRRKSPCRNCTAALTFADGMPHASSEVGVHKDGSAAYYFVNSSSFLRAQEGVVHVMQMITDITEVYELQQELRRTHDFYEGLIQNSTTGMVAIDPAGNVRVMNPSARALLEWTATQPPTAARLRQMLPEEFFAAEGLPGDKLLLEEIPLQTAQEHEVPTRFVGAELKSGRRPLGRAAFMRDLRPFKKLEQEKIDAERLAAVGQTVSGLAHTIKNLLMGLEGGMYMVDSGLKRGDSTRITSGWQMLQRNFEKTTVLVKDFLSFAKGRLPELTLIDPNALARDIVNLYVDAARLQGVELTLEAGSEVKPALLDAHGMETCITNLLSNGIDAAALRPERDGKVILRTREEASDLIFEVTDNGTGMDWEVQGKVFTTFFTTKGGKGTGLGLLTTRKIVQEHGGRIDVESTPGEGSTFRIRLPRERLETIAKAAASPGKSTDQSTS